jgi:hypothetical protein
MAPVDDPTIDDLGFFDELDELEDLDQAAAFDEVAIALQLAIDSLALLRQVLEARGATDGARDVEGAALPWARSGVVER